MDICFLHSMLSTMSFSFWANFIHFLISLVERHLKSKYFLNAFLQCADDIEIKQRHEPETFRSPQKPQQILVTTKVSGRFSVCGQINFIAIWKCSKKMFFDKLFTSHFPHIAQAMLLSETLDDDDSKSWAWHKKGPILWTLLVGEEIYMGRKEGSTHWSLAEEKRDENFKVNNLSLWNDNVYNLFDL